MSAWVKFLVVSGVIAAVGFAAQLQAGPSDARKAQTKLLCQRAARVDAIRKLSERINGLMITSKTTVKDFVTENDTIRASMTAFLNGMKETNVSYKEDGTCEVTMEVTLVEVITTLKQVYNAHYKGNHFKASDFQEMTQTNKVKVLTETGMGAPRSDEEETVGEPVVIKEASVESIDYMSARAKKYWLANVKPQGRLGAVRAARVDGMRRLVERLFGTYINSQTVVKDFVTEKDDINAVTAALLRGAREKSVNYHDNEPVVEVEMAVTLETVTETIKSWANANYRGDKARIREFEERITKVDRKELVEVGMGCVREDLMKGGTEMLEVAQNAMAWPTVISEKGTGAVDPDNDNKAQAKLMAKRAAEMDARRKLAERLDGLVIRSKTTVRDFVTESDKIKTAMQTYQQGAYVVEGSYKEMEDGTWECEVAIDTAPLWEMVSRYERTTTIKKSAD